MFLRIHPRTNDKFLPEFRVILAESGRTGQSRVDTALDISVILDERFKIFIITSYVIPAEACIQNPQTTILIPAFAGMTLLKNECKTLVMIY